MFFDVLLYQPSLTMDHSISPPRADAPATGRSALPSVEHAFPKKCSHGDLWMDKVGAQGPRRLIVGNISQNTKYWLIYAPKPTDASPIHTSLYHTPAIQQCRPAAHNVPHHRPGSAGSRNIYAYNGMWAMGVWVTINVVRIDFRLCKYSVQKAVYSV